MSDPADEEIQVITARVEVLETPQTSSVPATAASQQMLCEPPVPMEPPLLEHSPSSLINDHDERKLKRSTALFSFMADFPWPFLVIMPILFAFLIAFGWTKEDKIEESVEELWIARDGNYAQSKAYAAKYGFDKSPLSTFTAMAWSRDEGNILTAERLEEIRSRMEATERVMVSDMSVPLIDKVSLS